MHIPPEKADFVGRRPLLFLLIALGLLVGGAFVIGDGMLAPGVPAVVVLAFAPALLAIVMAAIERGPGGVGGLLKSLAPGPGMTAAWYGLSLLSQPAVALAAFAAAVAMRGPFEQFTALSTLALTPVILVLAVGEELGWTGYATEPLQRRFGALGACLFISAIGVAIHLTPYLQAGHTALWILAQAAQILGERVLAVWAFNRTGRSVLPAVLLHASYNLVYIFYPVRGSEYDPILWGPIQLAIALVIILATRGRLGFRPS